MSDIPLIIMHLTISQWDGKASNPRALQQVSGRSDGDNYISTLIPQSALRDIQAAAREARVVHAKHTLPWGDAGMRVLRQTDYLDHIERLSNLREEFNSHVESFLEKYQDIRNNHQTPLNVGLYPSRQELVTKFNMDTNVMELPATDDARVDAIGQAAAASAKRARLQAELVLINSVTEIFDDEGEPRQSTIERRVARMLEQNAILGSERLESLRFVAVVEPIAKRIQGEIEFDLRAIGSVL